SGASGPTIVSATASRLANATSVAMSSIGTLQRSGSAAVPALPGATNTFETRGDCAIFHASACSRPPPPTTRTFTSPRPSPPRGEGAERSEAGEGRRITSVPEVPHAGEHHRDAALVRRGDHLVVAHAAAGLDHGGGAVVGDDVEAIAERKERIRRDDRARKRQARVGRLDRGDTRRVDAAHLARTDAERAQPAAVDDRIRL